MEMFPLLEQPTSKHEAVTKKAPTDIKATQTVFQEPQKAVGQILAKATGTRNKERQDSYKAWLEQACESSMKSLYKPSQNRSQRATNSRWSRTPWHPAKDVEQDKENQDGKIKKWHRRPEKDLRQGTSDGGRLLRNRALHQKGWKPRAPGKAWR